MAVLAPVLERKLNTEEKTAEARNTALMNEEDRHNSQISSKYKALINPTQRHRRSRKRGYCSASF